MKSPKMMGVLLAMMLCLVAPALDAHFNLDTNTRIIHIDKDDDGFRMLMRLPAPLVLAVDTNDDLPALDYVISLDDQDQTMHYFDSKTFEKNSKQLGKLILQNYQLRQNKTALKAKLTAVRAHPDEAQPKFATLNEAISALEGGPYSGDDELLFVGDTVLDIDAIFATDNPDQPITIQVLNTPSIEDIDKISNLIIDNRTDVSRVYRATGTLESPIAIGASAKDPFFSFIKHGIDHILGGLDHVLFVVCLILGTTGVVALLWRVTGFTIGHTITLVIGFLGYAPQSAWFIPTIELLIAISIIYAGVAVYLKELHFTTIGVTVFIGLIHGFGFSFVFHDVLSIDSQHLLTSLLSFNIGVEIGQACIVLFVFPLLLFLHHRWPRASLRLTTIIATLCIAIAALWTGERSLQLAQQLL